MWFPPRLWLASTTVAASDVYIFVLISALSVNLFGSKHGPEGVLSRNFSHCCGVIERRWHWVDACADRQYYYRSRHVAVPVRQLSVAPGRAFSVGLASRPVLSDSWYRSPSNLVGSIRVGSE